MSDVTPEAGPDGRPRPRYGEYATPEEQRARIQQPDVATALDAATIPVASDARARAAQASSDPAPWLDPASPGLGAAQQFGAAPVRARRPADRIATIVLLVYGAVSVFLSVPSFFDLPAVANQTLEVLGASGEFTNLDSAALWGPVAAAALVGGFVVTAVLSLRRLRSGRLTWWVPLVGAVATYAVVYVCLAVPLVGDPAFVEYATTR
ncbi:MAG: DUF6264 family protein [Microbacterium sp.]